jgi:hypothetical protein
LSHPLRIRRGLQIFVGHVQIAVTQVVADSELVFAGALVVPLLLFVALSVPPKHTVQRPRGTVTGQQDPTQPSESSFVEPSLLPITDSGRPPAKASHEGFVDEQDLQRTATRQLVPSSRSTQSGTLASVPPSPEQWQAPPYQPAADGSTQPRDLSKAEREALEKSSVAYVRNGSASQGGSQKLANSEPVIDLGLPTGSRLRARLESTASTAVRTPVLAVIEYNYEREGGDHRSSRGKSRREHSAGRPLRVYDDRVRFVDDARRGGRPHRRGCDGPEPRPPKGKVEGKNTGKNVLVRSLSGIGEVGAMLVGRGKPGPAFKRRGHAAGARQQQCRRRFGRAGIETRFDGTCRGHDPCEHCDICGARKNRKLQDRFRESHIGQFAVHEFGENGSTSPITAAAAGTTANGSGQRGEITSTGRVRCSPTFQNPVSG